MADLDEPMDEGEAAEWFADLLKGGLGDPARYCELHGITVVGLDLGEVLIRSKEGDFRLIVKKVAPDDDGFAVCMAAHEEEIADALCAADERRAEGR